MPDPVSERALLEELGRDVASLFGHAPQAQIALRQDGWIGLSGEADAADLNMAAIYPGASPGGAMEIVRQLEAAGLALILLLPEQDETILSYARQSGLQIVAQIPVMERQAGPIDDSAMKCRARLGSPDEMEAAMALAARAFSLPPDQCVRALPPALLDEGQRELWIAQSDGEMLGVGLFIRDGERVGIYTMATQPERQRCGAGRAVLVAAMQHYQERGVTRFTLGATAPGFPLYERVGFTTRAQLHVCVIGASTQFPG